MKTRNKVNGYKFRDYGECKEWVRGHIAFREAKKLIGSGKYIECIAKSDLNAGTIEVASLSEHKRFLTDEGYEEYVLQAFNAMAERG